MKTEEQARQDSTCNIYWIVSQAIDLFPAILSLSHSPAILPHITQPSSGPSSKQPSVTVGPRTQLTPWTVAFATCPTGVRIASIPNSPRELDGPNRPSWFDANFDRLQNAADLNGLYEDGKNCE